MNTTESLLVYSLPVSGGCFVAQIGLLIELYEAFRKKRYLKYSPDLIFSSSGGNVAAYLGMAADWSGDGFIRVLKYLSKDVFIKSWFPEQMNFLPTGIAGIFTGSLYREGEGGNLLFKRFFTEDTIKRTEVWTGTFNSNTYQSEFFCNLHEADAIIKQSKFTAEMDLYGAMPLRYVPDETSKSIDVLAKITHASASIPVVTSNIKIGEHKYADGGVMYSSPSRPLFGQVYNHLMDVDPMSSKKDVCIIIDSKGEINKKPHAHTPKRLEHFYIAPYDLDAVYVKSESRLGVPGAQYVDQVLHANILMDRSASIDTLKKLSGDRVVEIIHIHYPSIEEGELHKVLGILDNSEHFTCILYPYGTVGVSMFGFTHDDLMKSIAKTRRLYGAHLWYLPKK